MKIENLSQEQKDEILAQIQETIRNNELSDFYIVEEIVLLFEKYDLDIGSRHDF